MKLPDWVWWIVATVIGLKDTPKDRRPAPPVTVTPIGSRNTPPKRPAGKDPRP